jgi:hypothetical protein
MKIQEVEGRDAGAMVLLSSLTDDGGGGEGVG